MMLDSDLMVGVTDLGIHALAETMCGRPQLTFLDLLGAFTIVVFLEFLRQSNLELEMDAVLVMWCVPQDCRRK